VLELAGPLEALAAVELEPDLVLVPDLVLELAGPLEALAAVAFLSVKRSAAPLEVLAAVTFTELPSMRFTDNSLESQHPR